MNDSLLPILLLVLGVIGGAIYKGKQRDREKAKQRVEDADRAEREGEVHAKLQYLDKVKRDKEKIDADIDARPVSDDPVADLADRITRPRRRRR